MIRSVFHDYQKGQRPRTGEMEAVGTITDYLTEIDYSSWSPAAKWVGLKAAGRAVPIIGGLTIVNDIRKVVTYVDKKYPSLGRQLYEDVMDAHRS